MNTFLTSYFVGQKNQNGKCFNESQNLSIRIITVTKRVQEIITNKRQGEIMLKKVLKASIIGLLLRNFSCTNQPQIIGENHSISPLERLIEGNKRFQENHPIHPDQTLERLRELQKGQHPFAVIISCSDSRVPPELIFDQGLGDLFVIRNAGNIISDYELGSIEYAV